MTNRIGKKALVLGSLLFAMGLGIGAIVKPAHAAGEGTFGGNIVDCFHPDAKFTSVTYAKGHGRHAWMGWIRFHEGRASGDAVMSFTMDMKTAQNGESFYRVTPLTDDGFLAPAPGCYMRDWQRY
jgi:hypothetical protein